MIYRLYTGLFYNSWGGPNRCLHNLSWFEDEYGDPPSPPFCRLFRTKSWISRYYIILLRRNFENLATREIRNSLYLYLYYNIFFYINIMFDGLKNYLWNQWIIERNVHISYSNILIIFSRQRLVISYLLIIHLLVDKILDSFPSKCFKIRPLSLSVYSSVFFFNDLSFFIA